MIRTAMTENGMVRGIEAADPRITAFKGIPFAAPPVGENRWRAPQPCANWEGVKDAYRFAPISVQDTPGIGDNIYIREWHVDSEIAMGEDCLYLNVWTSAKKPDEKQPVLVWYFGGGLQWGYPSEMEFDGERIARRGVVVVTVNYSLMSLVSWHIRAYADQPDAPPISASDQQQDCMGNCNIQACGGDPEISRLQDNPQGRKCNVPDDLSQEFGSFQKQSY
jgi:para-nitrobenzyl esterase